MSDDLRAAKDAGDNDAGDVVTYWIDGRKIASTDDFYAEIGRAVNGPGGYFGRNLDALTDCLRGGFGTPDDKHFQFVWTHSAVSRSALMRTRMPGVDSFFGEIADVFRSAGVPLRWN